MEKLVNVTCSNPQCTKPLFAFEKRKGNKVAIHSFGAFMQKKPSRLGVDPKAVATCPHCGTETEFDGALLP
jgi:hypothetical protein